MSNDFLWGLFFLGCFVLLVRSIGKIIDGEARPSTWLFAGVSALPFLAAAGLIAFLVFSQ